MSKWPIFDNFALKFQALKNDPRKVKILVRVGQQQNSSWAKDPSLQDGWFGQGESLSEGEVKTFQALFSRPAAFDPYTQYGIITYDSILSSTQYKDLQQHYNFVGVKKANPS